MRLTNSFESVKRNAPSAQHNARARKARATIMAACFEPLEVRRLMSGGTLSNGVLGVTYRPIRA